MRCLRVPSERHSLVRKEEQVRTGLFGYLAFSCLLHLQELAPRTFLILFQSLDLTQAMGVGHLHFHSRPNEPDRT